MTASPRRVPVENALEVLTFGISGEIFALDATMVGEILDNVPVTEVPTAPAYAPGLINVRGRVAPMVDLREIFGMERREQTDDSRIIVIEVNLGGQAATVGIYADKVFEVTTILPETVEDVPRIGMRWRPEFIRGIGRRQDAFLIILDIDQVFAAETE